MRTASEIAYCKALVAGAAQRYTDLGVRAAEAYNAAASAAPEDFPAAVHEAYETLVSVATAYPDCFYVARAQLDMEAEA
jgi:hypothetical protein